MDKSFLQNFKNLKNLSSKIKNAKLKQVIIILLGAVISALSVWFAFLIKGVVEAVEKGVGITTSIVIAGVVAVVIFVLSALINFLSEKFKLMPKRLLKNTLLTDTLKNRTQMGILLLVTLLPVLKAKQLIFLLLL